MQIVYTGEKLPDVITKSLFLAGPTPRSPKVSSWRPAALDILKEKGYDGVVFVPEYRSLGVSMTEEERIDWEHAALNMTDCIVFWVPRNLRTLPGFTTNIEFGLFAHSGKAVLGAPPKAPKIQYLRILAEKTAIPHFTSLEETIDAALAKIGDGAARTGGERNVPLHIWHTPSFQSWHRAQKTAGNELADARAEWTFRVGKKRNVIYAWALHVDIYVRSENRHKTNEIVIARPDIASVVLYRPSADVQETKIVLVREFRSPASTPDGFIWELPGGSSWHAREWPDLAIEETKEETGLKLNPARLRFLGSRQLAGTFSSHKAHVFAAELTEEEFDWLKQREGIAQGLGLAEIDPTGERTYIQIRTIKEIVSERLVDWSTLGMIFSILLEP